MPATARRYLRVDHAQDERLDPFASTEAAALLLKQNYSVLQDWPLAITAYNHGLSGVRRAQRELGTGDIAEIVNRYRGERFGFASRNFYAAFLAAVDIAADPEHYLGTERDEEAQTIELKTPAYLPVDVVLAAYGVDKDRLRELNPSLHHAVWNGSHFIPSDYGLRLPGGFSRGEAESIMTNLARHFGFSSQRPYGFYEVRLGDSISGIAQRHGTSVDSLVAMNGLSTADEISAGATLRVPLGPIPKPLGPGAAAMLQTRLERGDLHEGAAMVVDVPRVLAIASGIVDSQALEHEGLGAHNRSAGCAPPGSPTDPRLDPPAGVDVLARLSPSGLSADLAADPADYGVARDGSIEIQLGETMGHYGDWLDTTSSRLRRRLNMDKQTPLIVGRRLKLDFSRVSHGRFEQRRRAFHDLRQRRYFEHKRIAGVLDHRVRPGDNLWLLAEQQYRIPMWLLRQYNPDIKLHSVLALGDVISVPVVEQRDPELGCVAAN
jgi:membrane-bound lytic murein transglycosylase D